MAKIKDRTGERYGRLVVLEHYGKDNKGNHLWRCKCDCGNEKVVVSGNLSTGKTKSCGCLKKEFLARKGNQFGQITDRKIAIFKVQYSHIKRRHKKFNGEIFSFDDFVKKSESPCYYCGMEWSRELQDRRNETIKGGLVSDTIVRCNGIDRIDSNIGYTSENTVSCCKYCNTAKNTMTQEQFKEWIVRVYKNYINE